MMSKIHSNNIHSNNIYSNNNNNGIHPIHKLFELKEYYKIIPQCIVDCNEKTKIIMEIPTDVAVTNRQKHPVKKKIINLTDVETKIMSLLNKLSIENMNIIVTELLKIDKITSCDGMTELVNHIVKKVGTEKQFVQLYAQLCCKLSGTKLVNKTNNANDTFISLVSVKIKLVFDSFILGQQNDTKENNYIFNNDGEIDKLKVSNYVQFIGWLYSFGMLKYTAVEYCLDKLINKTTSDDDSQYCIEITITLMKIIIKKYKEENIDGCNKYYCKLNERCDKCTSFRYKFLSQDFFEKNKL